MGARFGPPLTYNKAKQSPTEMAVGSVEKELGFSVIDTESPTDDPILPEVYTATVACIYNKGLQGVTRMAYSPSLWLMAIGW